MFYVFRTLGWMIAGICYGVVGLLTVLFALFLVFPPIIILMIFPPGWYLLPFVAAERYRAYRRFRERQAEIALTYIDQALRLNQPLVTVIKAGAHSEPLNTCHHLRMLHACLLCGDSLAFSLEQSFAALGKTDISKIAAAERMGRVRQVISAMLQRRRRAAASRPRAGTAVAMYLLVMLLATVTLLFFNLIFIAPKMHEIFADFGTTVPESTLNLYAFGAWLGGPLLRFIGGGANPDQVIPGFFYVVMLAFVVGMLALFVRFTPPGRHVGRVLLWKMPVLGHATRSRGMADVCEMLAEAVEAGMPLERTLQEINQLDLNPALRNRLDQWIHSVESGTPVAAAARAVGMPGILVDMLASSTAGDDSAALFRFLQSHYESRFSRINLMIRSACGPVIVIAVGLLVGWVVINLFYPLVTLIYSLTGVFQPL